MSRADELKVAVQAAEAGRRKVVEVCNKCSKADASILRAMLQNWRGVDDVTLCAPRSVAEQLLRALDALAIIHGNEEEMKAMDEALGRLMGGGPRP